MHGARRAIDDGGARRDTRARRSARHVVRSARGQHGHPDRGHLDVPRRAPRRRYARRGVRQPSSRARDDHRGGATRSLDRTASRRSERAAAGRRRDEAATDRAGDPAVAPADRSRPDSRPDARSAQRAGAESGLPEPRADADHARTADVPRTCTEHAGARARTEHACARTRTEHAGACARTELAAERADTRTDAAELADTECPDATALTAGVGI
jgi:hypothetical protein